MVCRLPWRRAASSTITVPVALAWWLATGSATLRGTLPSAARCTTASAPANARSSASSSRMVPSTTSSRVVSSPWRLATLPFDRSSMTATESTPSAPRSISHRFDPMNPAPPVTTTRMTTDPTGAGGAQRIASVVVRALWVVKGLGPGGAERLLVAAAGAHDRERFDIECAYVLPWKDHLVGELESAGVRTVCVSDRRRDPRWPLRLARLIRSGDYDVVHVHSPLPGSVARLAARSMRPADRPGLVSTEHNRWETHRLPTRLLNRVTSRWDDASFAVTDEVRESMRGPVGERAVTLRHGIDVDRVAAERRHRAEVRAELGIDADEFVVVTAANFRPQKDYPNLLRAARLLADRDVAVRIVAIGQGPDDAEIRALHAS